MTQEHLDLIDEMIGVQEEQVAYMLAIGGPVDGTERNIALLLEIRAAVAERSEAKS